MTRTRRPWRQALLPAPALSLLLAASWLLLAQSLSLGQGLLALVLGLALPPACGVVPATARTRWRRLPAALRLSWTVLCDIVRGSVEVGLRALLRPSGIVPRDIDVPLHEQDPARVTLLAMIVSLTPGTLAAGHDARAGTMRVHVFHCPDDAAAAAVAGTIRHRYEMPLAEILS